MPLAVAVLTRPRGVVELVGDVVVLVPDDQVRVAPVAQPDNWPVLIVTLEDRIGRNRRVLQVALGRVSVHYHVDFRLRVAVHDVERNAVKRVTALGVLAEVGMELAVAVEADDVVDDRRRVRGDRRGGDDLVPGVVRREELLAQKGHHNPLFERFDSQESPVLVPGRWAKNVRTFWCRRGLCLCGMTASQSSSKGGVATLDWRSSIGGIVRHHCRNAHHQTTAKLSFVPRKVTVRPARTNKRCAFLGSPRVFPLLGKFSPLLLGRGFGSKNLIKTCGRNLMQSLQRGHVEGGRT